MTKPAMTPEQRAFLKGYRQGLHRGRAGLRALELSVEDRLAELQDDCEAAAEKLGSEADAALAAQCDDDPLN